MENIIEEEIYHNGQYTHSLLNTLGLFDNLNVTTLSYLITPSRLFLWAHSAWEKPKQNNPN